MLSAMITPDSIIDALGGTTAVAEALSLNVSTVSCWRGRGGKRGDPDRGSGGIPPGYWLSLVELASSRSVNWITLETFAELSRRKPEEARA